MLYRIASWVAIIIVAYVLFLVGVRTAFARCHPIRKRMSPGLVWLQSIPLFTVFRQSRRVVDFSTKCGAMKLL